MNKHIQAVYPNYYVGTSKSGLHALYAAPGGGLITDWHPTVAGAEQEFLDWFWGDYKYATS